MEKTITLCVTRAMFLDEDPVAMPPELIQSRINTALEVACAYIRDSSKGVSTSYGPLFEQPRASLYKINAIKALRYVHPILGLKDAKDVVDLVLEAAQNPELPGVPTDLVAKALM